MESLSRRWNIMYLCALAVAAVRMSSGSVHVPADYSGDEAESAASLLESKRTVWMPIGCCKVACCDEQEAKLYGKEDADEDEIRR